MTRVKTTHVSKKSLRKLLLVSVAALSFASACPAFASDVSALGAAADTNEASEAKAVETIIVIGNADRPISVAPRGLSVSLGQADFAAVNALNVEDLMKYAPNFFVRKRYVGDANGVPGFRGTHSSQSARTLVMVDGFVVSNFLGNSFGFPPKWGVVGPGEVRQFDIVYGPYSSRYGGNSMGGIVSMTTRAPEGDEAFATAQVFSQAYEQYGSKDTYNGYTFEGGVGFKPKDQPFAARVSWRHFENVGQPQSWFQLTPTTGVAGIAVTGAMLDPNLIVQTPIFAAEAAPATVQDQVKLRLDLDLPNAWKAQGLLVGWKSAFDTTKPESYLRDANNAPVFTGRVQFDGKPWTLPALNLSLNERLEYLAGVKLEGPALGWDVRANLSRFWVDTGETKTSNGYIAGTTNGAGTFTQQEGVGWTTLDMLAKRSFGRFVWAVGAQTNHYDTTQNIYSTTNWRKATGQNLTNVTGGSSRLSGLFAEVQTDISDTLSVVAGLRGDWWQVRDGRISALAAGVLRTQSYAARGDDAISPSVSATWNFAPDWTVQLSLAGATRFPTVGELFQGRLTSAGDFDANSFDPNLKPEHSKDANLLVRRDFGKARLTGSIYWQEVDDTIFSVQGFNQFGVVTTSFKNIDLVRHWGWELIGESRDLLIEGLSSDINIAYLDSKIIKNAALPVSQGVQFPRIPTWRVNGNVRYRFAKAWQANLGWRYASRPNTNLQGTQRGDTFGYASEQFIIDARVTWDASERVQVSLGVDNLNNDAAWAFHPFPQRTVSLEVKWRQGKS
jgi:iron complex outermembrane recepter protein